MAHKKRSASQLAPLLLQSFTVMLRIMFAADNIVELVAQLSKHGAEVVGEMVNFENIYRL